jgi:hypothetical protein
MGKQHSHNKARGNSKQRARRSNFRFKDVAKPKEKVSIMPRGINTVTGPLLSYLEEHRGEQVTLPELVKAVNCNEGQIRASLSYMRGKNFAIDTVVTGQCWVYRAAPKESVVEETKVEEVVTPPPTPKPGPPPMIMPKKVETNEYLRVVDRSDERLILIDARGKIYKAVEI